jgi:probable HAF family extracellular repeat protein
MRTGDSVAAVRPTLLALVLVLAPSGPAFAAASITEIDSQRDPTAISDDGRSVTMSLDLGAPFPVKKAYYARDGVVREIGRYVGVALANGATVHAMSPDGSQVVGEVCWTIGITDVCFGARFVNVTSDVPSEQRAVPFDEVIGWFGSPPAPVAVDFIGQALGVSDDGSVAAGWGEATMETSEIIDFIWRDVSATPTLISGGSAPPIGRPGGLSRDGAVYAGVRPGSSAAERWEAGSWAGPLFDDAFAVDGDGSVIVGQDASQAVAWSSGSVVSLGDLPGGSAQGAARGVSADGERIVGWASTEAGQRAFLWTPEAGMQALEGVLAAHGVDLTGWTLYRATAISPNGRFVAGIATTPAGQTRVFVAELPLAPALPALHPTALAVLAVVLASLGVVAGRGHRGGARWRRRPSS